MLKAYHNINIINFSYNGRTNGFKIYVIRKRIFQSSGFTNIITSLLTSTHFYY